MAESIQTYYEKLIAKQSDTIRKYLIKYGLTEWDMVSPTLTQKERELILKRYREGTDFRAVSFFRRIVTRAQMNEAVQEKRKVGLGKNNTNKINIDDGKRKSKAQNHPTKHNRKESHEEKIINFCSLQEYYLFLVSKQILPIRKFLRNNDLLTFESAFVWLEDSDREIIIDGYIHNDSELLADKLFSKLSKYYRICKYQTKPTLTLSISQIQLDDEKLSTTLQSEENGFFLPCAQEKDLSEIPQLEERGLAPPAIQKKDLPKGSQFEDSTPVRPERNNEREKLFLQWRDLLPEWYNQVLTRNGVSSFKIFVEEIVKPSFSYKGIKHCGQKTIDELRIIAAAMIWLFSQLENNSEKSNETNKYLLSKLTVSGLSMRAINCLESIDVKTIKDLLIFPLDHDVLFTMRNCGRKTVAEIEQFVASIKKYYDIPKTVMDERIEKYLSHEQAPKEIPSQLSQLEEPELTHLPESNLIIENISDEDFEFANRFRNEYGHWPMVYILFRKIVSLLKPREFAAFEDRFGIQNHKELTRQWALQLFENAYKKLRTNSSLKQLCDNEDWNLYYVNNIPNPVFENVCENYIWLEVERMISQEKYFLNDCFNETTSAKENYNNQTKLLSHINISTFKVFLQFWGHLPLWQGKTCLVPYCPQEKKGYYDPLSPIVIDKRFASFNFSKSIAEIGRLKKEKTANDIILSIEKYFVDNEDYWKRFVYLSEVDKASLVLILKKLFRDVCNANIADDNLVFKANRVNFSDKLYGILSIEGTRLHRDELFKRLKKTCEEQGVQCGFSNSSQITTFLTKDPRIIPYGKSSYWGLKEWGETYGSIRELALRMMKDSTEPIHIEALTKLIMESRPDSNEKSISSIIRQTTSTGELLLFWGDYIGYPNAKYIHEFILMPRSFDEWLKAFKEFVLNNKRYPSNDKGFEGFLNRWYQRAIKLTNLSAEEILKIDALEKELTHYPHNAIENNFLHKCNLYKKFVEGNNRMLEETDDPKLFKWFYNASLNYITYKDNRSSYFSQLLQFLSKTLL